MTLILMFTACGKGSDDSAAGHFLAAGKSDTASDPSARPSRPVTTLAPVLDAHGEPVIWSGAEEGAFVPSQIGTDAPEADGPCCFDSNNVPCAASVTNYTNGSSIWVSNYFTAVLPDDGSGQVIANYTATVRSFTRINTYTYPRHYLYNNAAMSWPVPNVYSPGIVVWMCYAALDTVANPTGTTVKFRNIQKVHDTISGWNGSEIAVNWWKSKP